MPKLRVPPESLYQPAGASSIHTGAAASEFHAALRRHRRQQTGQPFSLWCIGHKPQLSPHSENSGQAR